LYLLIIQQQLPTISTLTIGKQALKQLIVIYKETNLAGKVDACAIMSLPHNLLAYGNASDALDLKGGKVPEDQELI
jgi:hypothetical protein